MQTPVLHSLVAIDPSKPVSPSSGTLSSPQKSEEFTFYGLIVSHEREEKVHLKQSGADPSAAGNCFFLGGWDVEQSPMVISCRYNQIISKEAVGARRKWNKEANLHLSALSNIIMCQQTQANSLAERHYGFCFLINKIETLKTPSTHNTLSIIYFLTFLAQWRDTDEQRHLQGTVWFRMLGCESIQQLQWFQIKITCFLHRIERN